MKTLLVTGATGFVGRNLVLRALGDGFRVLAPVRDAGKLRRQLEREGADVTNVVPLPCEPAEWDATAPDVAVLSAGVLFARNRDEYFETNVKWTLRILAALPPSCRVIVLSSQSAGGPTPDGVARRTEETPDTPITWYGESKLALETALRRDFSGRNLTVLRPPMILGARDSATLPLFKMAAGPIRTKPGLRDKTYSFLAVEDVVGAIFAALAADGLGPYYICRETPITDVELIETAARVTGSNGVTLRVPQPVIRAVAAVVDAVPAFRQATPSLTRDRAREIWPWRWVVDGSAFGQATGWKPKIGLEQALRDAWEFYRREGQL